MINPESDPDDHLDVWICEDTDFICFEQYITGAGMSLQYLTLAETEEFVKQINVEAAKLRGRLARA